MPREPKWTEEEKKVINWMKENPDWFDQIVRKIVREEILKWEMERIDSFVLAIQEKQSDKFFKRIQEEREKCVKKKE